MRLIAEEQRSGTLEMLITLPVKDSDVIARQVPGRARAWCWCWCWRRCVYPLVMFKRPWNLGPLDIGSRARAATSGSRLFSAAAVAIGLLISSLDREPGSRVLHHLLRAARRCGSSGDARRARRAAAPSGVVLQLRQLSDARSAGFWRGLIDTRDVIFFLSVTASRAGRRLPRARAPKVGVSPG